MRRVPYRVGTVTSMSSRKMGVFSAQNGVMIEQKLGEITSAVGKNNWLG